MWAERKTLHFFHTHQTDNEIINFSSTVYSFPDGKAAVGSHSIAFSLKLPEAQYPSSSLILMGTLGLNYALAQYYVVAHFKGTEALSCVRSIQVTEGAGPLVSAAPQTMRGQVINPWCSSPGEV